jgi:large subunit ribosomal protein L32
MRHTRAHTGKRRSHHALKGARFTSCPKCGAKHLMHRVCQACGTYRGRVVIDVLKKTVKTQKKSDTKKAEAKKSEVKK